jgi:GrpB-like predicted nucleotidyltransferase (UPF0157 family)
LRPRSAPARCTRALRIEHVGSTSVPGLPAKPVIDLDLTVAAPAHEAGWLPQLQAAGFVLTVREPWWHEHRLVRGAAPAANVAKREAAEATTRGRGLVMDYNQRKEGVIREIYGRAFRAAGFLD